MSRKFLLLALSFLLVSCSPAPQPPISPSPYPLISPSPSLPNSPSQYTILALGDSLTAGYGLAEENAYPAVLQEKLQADGWDVRVINGGISGETSTSALARLDWVLQNEPDVVIVETGGNDALRGVDLSLTKANIDAIVGRIDERGAVVVLAGMQIVQNLGDEYTSEFAAMYPAIAEAHNAILIPFFLEGVAADPALNQADFIHPNEAGYRVLVDHIFPFVVEALEKVK